MTSQQVYFKALENAVAERRNNLPAYTGLCAEQIEGKPVHEQIQFFADEMDRLSRAGQINEAWSLIVNSRQQFGTIPLHLVMKLLFLAVRTGRSQDAAYECLGVACDAVRSGNYNLAMEAVFSGLTLDQDGHAEIAASPELALDISRLYEHIANSIAPGLPTNNLEHNAASRRLGEISRGRPVRAAMIVPNMIDYTVAYTKRILYFARYLDPAKYKLRVFVTENMSMRDPESCTFPYGCTGHTTETSGRATMQELRERRIPVHIASRTSGFIESAITVARQLEEARIDIAIFQGNLICPIDWLACRLASVPVKCAIHNGTSMMVPGMSAVFVDNPENIEREGDMWLPDAGERIVLAKGTDIEETDRQQPLSRAEFGIPGNAVAIGTLSNHLQTRMSEPYMRAIAEILRAHPIAHFMALGSETLPEKTAFFKTLGVAERVHFCGKQTNPAAALKMLDIYAGEFPAGGSQSVIEALACGLPVAAVWWSKAHHESVSARVVGEEYAIPNRDVNAYCRLISSWIKDAALREKAGRAMRERAERLYSASAYVTTLMDTAGKLLLSKLQKAAKC